MRQLCTPITGASIASVQNDVAMLHNWEDMPIEEWEPARNGNLLAQDKGNEIFSPIGNPYLGQGPPVQHASQVRMVVLPLSKYLCGVFLILAFSSCYYKHRHRWQYSPWKPTAVAGRVILLMSS